MSRRSSRIWIPRDHEITPPEAYVDRREIVKAMMAAGLLPAACLPQDKLQDKSQDKRQNKPTVKLFQAPKGSYPAKRNPGYKVPERDLTKAEVATSYNNFYEFTTSKTLVKKLVKTFSTAPWKVEIKGLVEKPGTVDLEDFFKHLASEERVYRFRCVEAWAMTVPWTGFPMRKFLEWIKPTSKARYVRMVTFMKPKEAPNQDGRTYKFPYYEALSLEEASNELTMLAHGIYGKELPRQNGAPLRLIVPWKYGLKSIKSIVRFEFTQERPPTFWNKLQAHEYSWHSNVEPDVPHPRWSQATERLIGNNKRVKTKPYNGYGDYVARLYQKNK
ncbi:MAG: protein-methionine-sulfoxide reductase catalytic subunit MsrP [Planctomycetota bacterium]|jgi:sulfoxide reductase catalytic subunit YedY